MSRNFSKLKDKVGYQKSGIMATPYKNSLPKLSKTTLKGRCFLIKWMKCIAYTIRILYLQYSKARLNTNYLTKGIQEKVLATMNGIRFE